MMMRNRAAALDYGIERRALDGEPLAPKLSGFAERVKGEIGRRSVGINVGEAAGDLALAAGRLFDGVLGRGMNSVVELFEAVPGDRCLERVVDHAAQDQ